MTYVDRLIESLHGYGLDFTANPTGGGCNALTMTNWAGEWQLTDDAQLPEGDGATLILRTDDGDELVAEIPALDPAGTAWRVARAIGGHA